MYVTDIDSRSVCMVHACRASSSVNYFYLVKGLRVNHSYLEQRRIHSEGESLLTLSIYHILHRDSTVKTTPITSTIARPTKDPQDGILMCPIVSSVRSPCYRLAKELAQIHSPLTPIHCQEHKRAFVDNLHKTQTTFHTHMVNLM